MNQLSQPLDPRFSAARNVWIATTREDGKPHLVPIWFVWHEDKFYLCTESKSVKIKNLQRDARISVAFEDGDKPLICEGTAQLSLPPHSAPLVALFKEKYNWDISTDASYNTLVAITPHKWLTWKTNGQ